MIIIHEVFLCKPGSASKLAKIFKDVTADSNELVHIMTDITGDFNRVIMEFRYESLAAYEQYFEQYMQNSEELQKMKEKMQGYQELYVTGSREIYKVW